MRKDISREAQLEARKHWKNAAVDSVAATFLIRKREGLIHSKELDQFEFKVTRRMKGAETGQYQAHQGGFMEVIDDDVWAGAAREVREETGYMLDPSSDLAFLGVVGPTIYRSEMMLLEGQLTLHITEVEAEPNVAFTLPLFIADVTGRTSSEKTDKEVTAGDWMTVREIIERFGRRGNLPWSEFNYFQFLVPAIHHIRGNACVASRRHLFTPGQYKI